MIKTGRQTVRMQDGKDGISTECSESTHLIWGGGRIVGKILSQKVARKLKSDRAVGHSHVKELDWERGPSKWKDSM